MLYTYSIEKLTGLQGIIINNMVHHDFLWDGERTEGIER